MTAPEKPRVFLTGGTGFLGAHLLTRLLAQGHPVCALRRPGRAAPIPPSPGLEWVDATSGPPLEAALRGCQVLVHLAAHGVNDREASLEDCLRWNLHWSLSLLEQARRAGLTQWVVAGSCFEYGLTGERMDRIPADAPLLPVGAYAVSKAAASLAFVSLARTSGGALQLLRPFHLFGEGEPAQRLWPALRAAAASGADFPMTHGRQVRDFTPVEEAAAAFLRAVEAPLPAGRIQLRNVGTGRARTLLDFAEEWWARFGGRGRLLPGAVPPRPHEIMRYVADATPVEL